MVAVCVGYAPRERHCWKVWIADRGLWLVRCRRGGGCVVLAVGLVLEGFVIWGFGVECRWWLLGVGVGWTFVGMFFYDS